MSEQDIVVADQAHISLPPEVNQNSVKSRIDDLISSGAADKDEPEEIETVEAEKRPDLGESLEESSVDDELDSLEAEETAPETEEGEEIAPVETLDAKKLAEKLDIPIDELYSMKFPYGEDGDAITLGELKDAGIRARTIDQESESLSEERNSFINDQMKSRSELQSIVSMLPDGIPPELVQQANYQHQQAVQRERVSLLAALPEWQDPGVEAPARDAISQNLRQYGFQDVEINNMLDHRLVKLMHDFTRMRQKIVKPTADVRKMKKQGKSRPGSRQTKGAKQVEQARRQGRTDTRGAINTLLPR